TCECHLEGDEYIFGNGAAFGCGGNTRKESLAEAAPVGAGATTEGEGITPENPNDYNGRCDYRALHEQRKHILGTYQAAIEQGKARQDHEEHENGGNHHPCRITAVERRRCRLCRRGFCCRLLRQSRHAAKRCKAERTEQGRARAFLEYRIHCH